MPRKLPLIVALSLSLSASLSASSLSHDQSASQFDHFYEINQQWIHHSDACDETQVTFATDADRISLHLQKVISYLRLHEPAGLSCTQQSNRTFLLNQLWDYAMNKTFPTNHYHSERTPYFIDNYGVHCAVGYMILKSGHGELAQSISKTHNYSLIEDIPAEPLLAWGSEFGFTLSELKWIQPNYVFPRILPIGKGANGDVNHLDYNFYTGNTFIVGDFDSLNGQPCNGIGMLDSSGILYCNNSAPFGKVNDIYSRNTDKWNDLDLYFFGDFFNGIQKSSIAKYNSIGSEFIDFPDQEHGEIVAGCNDFNLYVVFRRDSQTTGDEIWVLVNDEWIKVLQVNGFINDVDCMFGVLYFGGKFNGLRSFEEGDTVEYTGSNFGEYHLSEDSVVLHNLQSLSEVHKVLKAGYYTYLAGGTNCADPNNKNILCRYTDGGDILCMGGLHPFLDSCFTVRDLAWNPEELLLVGDHYYNGQKQGVAFTFSFLTGYVRFMDATNEEISAAIFDGDFFIVGGQFTKDDANRPLMHIGLLDKLVSTPDLSINSVSIYPVPFAGGITIKGIVGQYQYEIRDANGQLIHSAHGAGTTDVALDDLSSGVYFITISNENGTYKQKLIKQ